MRVAIRGRHPTGSTAIGSTPISSRCMAAAATVSASRSSRRPRRMGTPRQAGGRTVEDHDGWGRAPRPGGGGGPGTGQGADRRGRADDQAGRELAGQRGADRRGVAEVGDPGDHDRPPHQRGPQPLPVPQSPPGLQARSEPHLAAEEDVGHRILVEEGGQRRAELGPEPDEVGPPASGELEHAPDCELHRRESPHADSHEPPGHAGRGGERHPPRSGARVPPHRAARHGPARDRGPGEQPGPDPGRGGRAPRGRRRRAGEQAVQAGRAGSGIPRRRWSTWAGSGSARARRSRWPPGPARSSPGPAPGDGARGPGGGRGPPPRRRLQAAHLALLLQRPRGRGASVPRRGEGRDRAFRSSPRC